ncbi:pollen-specific leucine-rich repeat extensin-like protein 1 [Eumetopias jubatus]|uniref:pollen-specific leucine-rich repeat extensin-like protein 1 n=1 Tax=Eumetopias jubatus TaxID=34886 RepID=UPI001015D521|nr:pollen-specific leucine-rich repeat extensin-like protein 1 [Eumetopias jubatus]
MWSMTATTSMEKRGCRGVGDITPPSSIPTWALSPVSNAGKLASQEGHHHGLVKRLLLWWCQSTLFSAVREAQPWGQPHQRGPEPALRPAPPYPPPWDMAPPSPGAPFPLGSGCVPTRHHPVKPPVNPLLVPAPKYHQLPAPWSGAAIKLAPPGLHQETLLIHSPEAKHRETETPTWLGPLRLITPWGNRNMLQLCLQWGKGSPSAGVGVGPPCSALCLGQEDRDYVTSHQIPTPMPQSGPFLEVRKESSEPSVTLLCPGEDQAGKELSTLLL